MHTRATLHHDLRQLGVVDTDTLFVHSSFRSLGQVKGGAGAVIGALRDAVGPDGRVLMPSFNLVGSQDERAARWDVEQTPSSVGWLSQAFRQMPETVRSDHYSHSVAAQGRGSLDLVSGHLSQVGMSSPWDREPWGKTYSEESPMVTALDLNVKILMVGVDYESSTYVHLVEVMWWNARLAHDPTSTFRGLDRVALGRMWDQEGILTRGQVGDAACRLFEARAYVDQLLVWAERL